MKIMMRLWLVTFGIILIWIYFLFISPKIFNSQTRIIPDVIQMDEISAIEELQKNKIRYQITYVEHDQEVALKTIPYAGTHIKSDYVISLYIGKIMPETYHSFLGRVYDDVIDEIQTLCDTYNLKLQIEYEENDKTISGLIIRESLVDGAILNQERELCLTLAVNHSSYLLPNFVGLHLDEAIQTIEAYQLKVNLTYISTPVDEDIILFQSTPPNTLIQKNNPYTLDLYVSKGVKSTTVIDVDSFVEVIVHLGYEIEINYVDSNEIPNKLVAFEVQKLYDNNIVKYILWITK